MKHALALVVIFAGCGSSPPAEPAAPAEPVAAPAPPPDATSAPAPGSPPATPAALPETVTCPGGTVARVIRVEVVAAGTAVTVSVGSLQGVSTMWTATLGPERLPAELVRIDRTQTVLRVAGSMDQVRASPYVELCPP